MTGEEATVLLQLRSIWDDRYTVDLNGNGTWSAKRQGDHEPGDHGRVGTRLRHKISEDYAVWLAEARS